MTFAFASVINLFVVSETTPVTTPLIII